MSLLDEGLKEVVRVVVRDEIRAALKDFGGGSFGLEQPLAYEDAGKFLGCHANTIAGYVKRGLLPATGSGRMRRVMRADLLLVLEKLSTPPVVETPAETAERLFNQPKRKR